MKKTVFTLSLFAALMCSCTSALDPNEEPLIRAGGIIDRIYLTSEDSIHNESSCTVAIEDNKLVLTLSEKATFTVSIRHQEEKDFIFAQRYADVSSATINLSSFPNGSYTLYINKQGICCFFIKDGEAYTSNDDDIEEWDEMKNISSFFNTTLPNGEEILQYFFPDSSIDPSQPPLPSNRYHQDDTCYVVNSREELQALYWGNEELPQINFEKNTLILGTKLIPAGYSLETHIYDITDESIVITLIFKPLEGGFFAVMVPCYYWGLYEKLPQKNIVVQNNMFPY